jgi:hypothetical protein
MKISRVKNPPPPRSRSRRGSLARAAVVMLFAALGTVGLAAKAPDALAADADVEQQSRAHYKSGETHYAAGEYAQALAEYQAGFDAVPLPGFLINIAQCHRQLGEPAKARQAYEKFVLVAPDSPLVPEVKTQIAELDRDLETAKTAPPPPPPATEPPAVAVALGTPSPAAARAGSAPSASNEVLSLGDGQEAGDRSPNGAAGTDLTLRTAPAAPATVDEERAGHRWWLWGTLAAVVVGGTVTAIVLASSPGTETIHDGTLGTLRR